MRTKLDQTIFARDVNPTFHKTNLPETISPVVTIPIFVPWGTVAWQEFALDHHIRATARVPLVMAMGDVPSLPGGA